LSGNSVNAENPANRAEQGVSGGLRTPELEQSENEILRQRKEKLQRLREEEGFDPYITEKWDRADSLSDIRGRFEHLQPDESERGATVRTAGRLMTLRRQGKATFADLADEDNRMQLYFQINEVGEKDYEFLKKWVDTGDWIGVAGHPCRTRRGELTVLVTEFKLLCKALRPLPEKWHGLTDTEVRYRQRYTDLIANPDVREVFRKRAKIVASFRRTLEEHGTLEVETPTLSALAGGASARPFKSFHNALGLDMFLRIAPELYLKRLVAGMMGRVYEIGKNFRNEGIDTMHNPEFTMMEVYWAYANYEDMMNLAEELIRNAARAVGSLQIEWQGAAVDLERPFRRVSMLDIVEEETGVDFRSVTSDEEARKLAAEKGLGGELKGNESRFAVLNLMFETFCEEKLVEPTFVTGHPTEISPLSKRDPENPDYTHRFELFMYGKELANAFSELNDPLDQRARFEEQLRKKEAGDEEAADFDEDFINAIEMGLPPTGGMGVGIDRLVMFLTDSRSIRDVILFPLMKPKL
jgi:lysyl-tRNA synthetase class 2